MAPLEKKKKPLPKEEVKKRLLERKKESKKLLKEKRARLIVKNLPFKVTPEQLKEYFEQFGNVKSVDLLKLEDGKLKGCAFIQFELVQKAAKARHHTNGKEFSGRILTVDFAKAKNKYEKEKQVEIKEEENNEVIEIKEEQDSEDDGVSVKSDIPVNDIKNNEEPTKIENSSDDDKSSNSDTDNDDDEAEFENKHIENKKPHVISNDVQEGKTVFIKNVPFDASNEDLKECMKQFGPVYYALICSDKLTEHSKGTAFVKFVNKEDAEKALSAGTELKLLGNILDCHVALDRNSVNKKIMDNKESKKEPKDSRNLYLVKEGVILAGSPAAKGVSASDMAKRLQIEQYKTQILRNLNMFVSKERLVVHNLPPNWDDKKLRTLFEKYSDPGAVITEARIMRDMKNLDGKGIGKSKEYGFVTFSNHEHALTALRNLNNNPQIFSIHRRPVITFSIENKAIIRNRQKRLDRSKQNNPLSKTYNPNDMEKSQWKNGKITRKSLKPKPQSKQDEEGPKYSGVTTKPGVKEKMRSRYKLATQAKLHYENLKKQKKLTKKTLAEKRKEFIKQPKQKINKVNENDNFSKLVKDYKKKIVNASVGNKTKWYE